MAHELHCIARLVPRMDTVVLTRQLLEDASTFQPPRQRSLNAIHLAAAQRAGDIVRAVINDDVRMLSAAAHLGIVTASPR